MSTPDRSSPVRPTAQRAWACPAPHQPADRRASILSQHGRGRVKARNLVKTLEEDSDGIGWKLASKLVFSKIREAFGGRAKVFVSGSAPLGMDTAGWFADVGIRIFEGYGLTETSPVIALNYPNAHRIGTVGKALPNVECRFAEDGELEVKGPSIFVGYWKKEKETAEVVYGGWMVQDRRYRKC